MCIGEDSGSWVYDGGVDSDCDVASDGYVMGMCWIFDGYLMCMVHPWWIYFQDANKP